MTFGIAAFTSLFFCWCAWNSFVTWRYRNRFAKAFLEEFKNAYPDSASLLTPDLGTQIAYVLVSNKKLAKELNALERLVSKSPDYSPETQELVADLMKNKIELAGKVFNCLPPKVKSQIDKKAELIDESIAGVELSDDEIKKDRKKDEEKANRFGLKTWRFSILMNIYDITSRANLAAT